MMSSALCAIARRVLRWPIKYFNVRLVYGTLDGHNLLEEEAKNAEIVLSMLPPTCRR